MTVPAVELDEATINAQQESVLLAAEQQGYKPLVTEFAAPNVAAAVSYRAELLEEQAQLGPEPPPPSEYSGPEIAGLDYEEDFSLNDTQRVAKDPAMVQSTTNSTDVTLTESKQTTFEDPVAAILANRNMRLEALFSEKNTTEKTPEQTTQSQPLLQPQPQHRPNMTSTNPPEPQSAQGDSAKKSEIDSTELASHQLPSPTTLKPVDRAIESPKTLLTATLEIAQTEESEYPEIVVTAPSKVAMPVSTVDQLPSSIERNNELPRWAHEVDEWAALIEKMGLGGLVRLIANQSVWLKQGKQVFLTVHQSEQHLDSPSLREQIQRAITLALNQVVELELQYTDEILDTPLNIQRKIDADRLVRAKDLIYQDPIIVALQQQFAAVVDDQSIIALG